MHRLVSIYLPTLYFVFAKKSSPHVNLQMKRDIELQKSVAHTSIRLEKRESDQKIKVNVYSKNQRLSHQSEISNITLIMRGDYLKRIKKIKCYD